MESPRSVAHATTPSASWSLKARTAVGLCPEPSNASAALFPNSLELPGHSYTGTSDQGRPASSKAAR